MYLEDLNMQKKTFGMIVLKRKRRIQQSFKNILFDSSKGFFDWYLEYRELKPYFAKIYPIKKESAILMVGCGNSSNIS